VRDVVEGGLIVDIGLPSETEAISMLVRAAGFDALAIVQREEAKKVVDLCKRLPLTIGIAGKLIKQLSIGGEDWSGLVDLLQEELAMHHDASVEEGMIRASIKAIPTAIRKQVVQLFVGFALVAEDTHVPLPVISMIYDACGDGASETTPLSRLHTRKYLKILIDRSLVGLLICKYMLRF
jgi:hypothetical protein